MEDYHMILNMLLLPLLVAVLMHLRLAMRCREAFHAASDLNRRIMATDFVEEHRLASAIIESQAKELAELKGASAPKCPVCGEPAALQFTGGKGTPYVACGRHVVHALLGHDGRIAACASAPDGAACTGPVHAPSLQAHKSAPIQQKGE